MANSFLELAKERFSVRKFTGKPIEKEKLDKILEAGNVAPTAVNYQPQKIYVLQSDEALEKINSLCKCIYGAKTVLMIAYDSNADWKNPKQGGIHSGEQDVSIVATHIMLEAWELGIGSCWVNLFANDELSRAFDLPDNEKVVLLMPLGYADENAKPIEKWHFGYKAISDTVTYR
ncbi:MAG: nitroreductase family protein [Clostridia bacterium]|nr:nitroreductase family protein [Clostridia bacterium]MBR1624239.1 nitroreductase family protein [Clostridia bacterium]MBR1867223.1 nitroreductase family protein [Clostridia bacterium]